MTDIAFPPLIPREILFGNPERAATRISPDGRHLSWLAPSDGVLNIWVAPRDRPNAARVVTHDRHRGIQGYSWSALPDRIVFAADKDGDENWQVHDLDLTTGVTRALTPAAGIKASIVATSLRRRDTVIVTHNERDARYADLYAIDLLTGVSTLLVQNDGYAGFLCDLDLVPSLALRPCDDGGFALAKRSNDGRWQDWLVLGPDDAAVSGPIGLVADGSAVLMLDSRGRDTAALVRIDLTTGAAITLAADDRADIAGLLTDSMTLEPVGYAVTVEHTENHAIGNCVTQDFAHLDAAAIGDWGVVSRSEDDRFWIVAAGRDVAPGGVWLYDRQNRDLQLLHYAQPALADAPLVPRRAYRIATRDGLSMVSYLSLPIESLPEIGGVPAAPLPMVLLVHGGPHSRDAPGFDATHQWLANRGYAVLSVNFRGSSGFGKAFLTAAHGEWGRRMDDDLTDAARWAIDRGIADPTRIAIFGGSYGGYATLVGLTRNPAFYCCGIDIVGPSDLETLLASIPPYWHAARIAFYASVGDPRTESGRALLRDRSPIHYADRIVRPLLIAQGANDPRVPQAESDRMVAALRERSIEVQYLLFTDEGHGFVRPANRMACNAQIELFLCQYLGGRCEPL